jgi:hypothetical protein
MVFETRATVRTIRIAHMRSPQPRHKQQGRLYFMLALHTGFGLAQFANDPRDASKVKTKRHQCLRMQSQIYRRRP